MILVDIMGTDADICRAARVSYDDASTKKTSTDEQLIDYLMRHRHTSPFEMVTLKFEVKLPIFVERQWVRHRTCSMNEMSGRYSEMPEEYHMPHQFRIQDKHNKQGSQDTIGVDVDANLMSRLRRENAEKIWQCYHDEMAKGVAREQAREMLPLAVYTKKVWQMNLHNLFHFLRLRTSGHAQWEIRQYAEAIERIVADCVPLAYKAWGIHVKDAVTFSLDELDILKMLVPRTMDPSNVLKYLDMPKSRKREFLAKINRVLGK